MSTQRQLNVTRVIVQVLLVVVLIPLLPLFISWQWDWWEAWIYAFVNIAGFVISRLLAAKRHPDILAERARMTQHEDAKSWDKFLAPVLALGFVFISVVAGLDARFGWTMGLSLAVELAALLVLLIGWWLGSYALIENRYFSGVVRIQRDRDHHVVSSGPYRWMRHPGYAGALLTYLATPLFLGSLWALIPAILLVIGFVIRTRLEDVTLQAELEGYRDYAEHVRYRLLPGVW